MRYMGGKFRQGPAIARAVMDRHQPGMPYYEPFSGGWGSAFRAVPLVHANGGESFLSDVSEAVVSMWLAAMSGWVPPDHVTREEYDRVKAARDPKDPMTAFCGFGVSFMARWFGPYVDQQNYARSTKNSILNKIKAMEGCRYSLACRDYREVQPKGNAVVYLDPPYQTKTIVHDYGARFDHTAFWDYARRLVKRGNLVIATSFIVPDDWKAIYSWGDTISRPMGGAVVNAVDERIFVHESQYSDVEGLV